MLQQFWTWWTGELASFLPRWDMRKRLLRNARYEIRVAQDRVSVHHWKSRASLAGAAGEIGSSSTVSEALTHISWPSRVVLTLDESMCLRRNAKLPARESAHDDKMLQLDVERTTPFRRGSYVSLWKPARSDVVSRTIDQAIIRRDVIDSARSALQSARHRIQGIGIRGDDGALWPSALTAEGDPLGTTQSRFWTKSLIATLCLLAASAIDAHSYVKSKLQSEIDDIAALQDALQPKAVETRNAMTRTEASLAELASFKTMHRNRLSAVEQWNTVTALLPDDTVLQSFSQRGDTITLIGTGAKPEGLISKLEQSPAFKDVRFAAPLFRAPQNEAVQFTIELTSERGT